MDQGDGLRAFDAQSLHGMRAGDNRRPVRTNRETRRAIGRRGLQASRVIYDEAAEVVRTLPGLPGGAPYVPAETQEKVMEQVLDAIAAMRPVMAFNREQQERGLPMISLRRLRPVRAAAPDGLGEGIVLGEFTDEPAPRPSLVLPGALALPKRGEGLILP